MEIFATMMASFGGLDDEGVSPRPFVAANPGDLPANAESRAAAGDAEFSVAKGGSDMKVGSCGTDGSELIAQFAIYAGEPAREADFRFAFAIELDDAIVEIFHFVGFHGGVTQVFVGGIQRMIDAKV